MVWITEHNEMTPTQNLTIYCHGLPGSAAELSAIIPNGVATPTTLAPLDLAGFDRALSNASSDKAHIIGFSLGAMTALKIASQRPHHISQISLIAPAAPLELGNFLPDMAGGPLFKVAQKGVIPFKLFTAFQSLGVKIARKPIISTMFAGSPKADMELLSDGAFYSVLANGLKSSLGRENKAYREAVLAYVKPWADELSAITAPINIYHGTKDSWTPIEMAYALQKEIPSNVKVTPLANLGHYSALHKAVPEILRSKM